MHIYMVLAIVCVVIGLVFAVVGAWVAGEKDRSPVEGALLGLFLGPLGALIEALLPVGDHSTNRKEDFRPTLLSEAPDQPWLSEIGEQRETITQEQAWLRELENRHRPRA